MSGYVNTRGIKVTHNGLDFMYSGDGLLRLGYKFDGDTVTHPRHYKTGTVMKVYKAASKKPRNWWRAQCAFRGVPEDGEKEMLWKLKGAAPNVVLPELVELEKEVKTRWDAKHEAAVKREKAKREKAKRKIVDDKIKALTVALLDKESEQEVLVYKNDWHGVEEAAESLGLVVKAFDWAQVRRRFPCDQYYGLCIVVGTSEAAVDAQLATLRQEEQDLIKVKEQAAREREQVEELRERTEREEQARKVAAVAKESERNGSWDVTGTWKIFSDAIEEKYLCDDRDGMTLTIYRHVDKKGRIQMYAEFNFSICEGWMRFETQDEAAKAMDARASTGQKRKRHDDSDEDEDEDEDKDEDEDEYGYDSDHASNDLSQKIFYLLPTEVPSLSEPTWTYRWRGRETGEGEIEVMADQEKEMSMTFSGRGGAKLKGTWSCQNYVGTVEFHGFKTSMGITPDRVRIQSEWRSLSEKAWNRECARRWH
ncbi:hypothetical protein BU16DRAFT_391671 [Lophium mytilinum]|uniref:Uncharacterized protein n=1 Tax=Lophium mytilinum TaxID=390894 RepID=A0A6A6QUB8_9PEZI|nr:hypothetical protein BU16DRAFT_391671 [Lophium mytilinum]